MLKKLLSLFMALAVMLFIFAGCNDKADVKPSSESETKLSEEEIEYRKALEFIKNSQYVDALNIITSLGDYKDCAQLKGNFVFKCTKQTDDYGETIYTYDNRGNKLTYELISDELPYEKTTYKYNEKNQCIEEKDEGYTNLIAKHTYDVNGNLILTEYDNNGRIVYEYDANNNCIKEHKYYGEPYTGEHITSFTYDVDNKCTSKTEEDMTGILSTTTYTYDADGKLVKEENGRSAGSYENIEYTYDDDGYCDTKVIMTPNYTEIYSYEYDKYGNLIRCDRALPENYIVADTTFYEYILFYDGKLVNDYVQATAAKGDLTEEEIVKVTQKNLGVPDNDNITYDLSEKYYDIGKGLYYVRVEFYENGEIVAGANVHVKTGELVSSIHAYNINQQ